MEKLPNFTSLKNRKAVLFFSVNEEGNTIDTYIKASSEDKNLDVLLIEAINNMPKWFPAENINGEKVKQDFMFSFGDVNVFFGDGC